MNRPKIGLALGSGAARGLAHIGVIRALNEEKIPIDMVAGTSAGALIGALYCSGADLEKVSLLAGELRRKDLIDISMPRLGFIKGDKIEEIIKLLTKGKNIEDLDIPFKAIAADVTRGERVVIDKGPLYKAVRASISIPGIFVPVQYKDMVLVDGGIINRVPVSTVKEMGADIVIAIDVGFSAAKRKVDNIFDVLLQSTDMTYKELIKYRSIQCDVLIKPYLSNIDPTRFDQAEECSAIGYEATMAAVEDIKKAMKGKSI